MNKNKAHKKGAVIVLSLFYFLLLPVAIFSATYTVCSSGCDYTTLQLALNNAPTGNIIQLNQDITEDVTIDNYSKTFTIQSDGTRRTWTNSSARNLNSTNTGSYNLTFSGIDIVNTGGSPVIESNSSGSWNMIFSDCTIQNTSNGRLVYMQNGGNMYFYQSEIIGTGSTPEGLYIASGVNPPGGMYLENTIVRDIGGIALRCEQSRSESMFTIYNCTIAANGTGYQSKSGGSIVNTIFSNTDDLNLSNSASNANFTYCAFYEHASFAGTGNVFSVPTSIFTSYASRDLTLVCSDTTVVDKGTNMSAYYTVDKNGLTRPQGTAYDMGAYECPAVSAVKSADVSYATIGDTITFCITVTNSTTSDKDMYIWDTVPSETSYIDCSLGCTETGGLVVWFDTLGAGQNRSYCFWVRVVSYPFIIRRGEFFAGVSGGELKAVSDRRSVFEIDDWKYWMAFSEKSVLKN